MKQWAVSFKMWFGILLVREHNESLQKNQASRFFPSAQGSPDRENGGIRTTTLSPCCPHGFHQKHLGQVETNIHSIERGGNA